MSDSANDSESTKLPLGRQPASLRETASLQALINNVTGQRYPNLFVDSLTWDQVAELRKLVNDMRRGARPRPRNQMFW